MRRTRALLIAGGILFLAGQGLLASSMLPGVQSVTATIPAGPEWFYVYPIQVLGHGRVEGRFADQAGLPVDFFVFAKSQYDEYAFVGLSEAIFAGQGAGVEFSVDLPTSGEYYIV